jgi:Bacterial Ig domain
MQYCVSRLTRWCWSRQVLPFGAPHGDPFHLHAAAPVRGDQMPKKRTPQALRRVWTAIAILSVVLVAACLAGGYEIIHLRHQVNGLQGHGSQSNLQTSVLVPSNGATLKGSSVALDASASGPSKVTAINFTLSGGSLSSPEHVATASPSFYGWNAIWNTTSTPNGTYTLQSVATDSGGVTATSAGITVTIAN